MAKLRPFLYVAVLLGLRFFAPSLCPSRLCGL